MKRLTLEQKALRVIDWLVSGDLPEEASMKLAFNRQFSQEEAKNMATMIGHIYEIAHSAVPEHICYNVHAEWREKTLVLFGKLKKRGELSRALAGEPVANGEG